MIIKRRLKVFPFFRTPCLFYAEKEVLDSQMASVLFNKMFGNSWKFRLINNKVVLFLLGVVFQKSLSLPKEGRFLVYHGYDADKYFEIDHKLDVTNVYTLLKDNKFVKEKFLGYPIFYDVNSTNLNNGKQIEKFLKEHWERIKVEGEEVLHGDLNPYNVLLSSKGSITFVDKKEVVNNSVLFDHFYFFSCLLNVLILNDNHYRDEIVEELTEIYENIFEKEKKDFLISKVEEIDLSRSVLRNPKFCKERFGRLIEEIK